jgi:hypothetical protein
MAMDLVKIKAIEAAPPTLERARPRVRGPLSRRRKLIIIATIMALSTPALGQSHNGPSPEEIRDAVRDGVLAALSQSHSGPSADEIRDAVRDGILAADQVFRQQIEYQVFLQQQQLLRQQQELAHRNRCIAHPSSACP